MSFPFIGFHRGLAKFCPSGLAAWQRLDLKICGGSDDHREELLQLAHCLQLRSDPGQMKYVSLCFYPMAVLFLFPDTALGGS